MTEQVSQDFIFGTLATDELRLAQGRAARSGVVHAYSLHPSDPRPGDPVVIHITLGPRVTAAQVTCYYTTDGSEPAGERGIATRGQAIELARIGNEWDTLLWGYLEIWAGVIPAQADGTLVRYRVETLGPPPGDERWASEIVGVLRGEPAGDLEPYDEPLAIVPGQEPLWPLRRPGSYAYHVDEERVPDWLRAAVIYHVFIDRFEPGGGRPFAQAAPGGFHGGTLRGLIERLDYIADLGATVIWLSPLFPSPSHHGYDATDYAGVEARLGSADDLRELIAAAHARGLRILLDYVVNHVSHEHPAFQRALRSADAPEAAWFTFLDWPERYLSFFGVAEMPQIDADAPPARDYMIAHARHWLAQGIDGFRLDYANGPSHAFWSQFRAATRAASPDSVTIGEVVETPALQRTYHGRLDGCLDFVLMQAMRQLFAFDSITPGQFDGFLRRHLAFFPADFALPSFLDNHDMNRFLWVVRGDVRRLKLAALCQFTLPHPPIIYYGTEVGLSQQRDVRYADGSGHPEEARLPMLWGHAQDQGLLGFYRDLIRLRGSAPDLWAGERHTLAADDAARLYVYECRRGGRAALVALNIGGTEQRVRLPARQAYRLGLSSEPAAALDGPTLILPPLSGAALLAAG